MSKLYSTGFLTLSLSTTLKETGYYNISPSPFTSELHPGDTHITPPLRLPHHHRLPQHLHHHNLLLHHHSAADTAMKLIGYVNYKSINLESSLEKHFNVSGDGEKEAHLHLLSLRGPEDSAVYYCAASQHSDVETINMITLLIQVATLPLWVTGLSQTDNIHQTPTEILKRPEDKVQLSCSHNIPTYNTILWYQQSAQNTALKPIGYVTFTSPIMEDSFKERFSMSGDAAPRKTVYLHIPKLREAEDSAVYFCAARGLARPTVPPLGGLAHPTVPPLGGLAHPTVPPLGGLAHPTVPPLGGLAHPTVPPLGGLDHPTVPPLGGLAHPTVPPLGGLARPT
ncbi:unnamed protein product, partial [Coregonus sp. 'balchen']